MGARLELVEMTLVVSDGRLGGTRRPTSSLRSGYEAVGGPWWKRVHECEAGIETCEVCTCLIISSRALATISSVMMMFSRFDCEALSPGFVPKFAAGLILWSIIAAFPYDGKWLKRKAKRANIKRLKQYRANKCK